MRNTLVLAVASMAFAGVAATAAGAADVYRNSGDGKYAPVIAPVNNWAGFYAGANIGGANVDLGDVTIVDLATGDRLTVDASESQAIGGVHFGYNIQSGRLVYGVETDVNLNKTFDSLSSFRGRVGLAADNWLFYATGGVAVARIEDASETGFVAGGGIETKLSRQWSIGVEGLYYAFDKEQVTLTDGDYNYEINIKPEVFSARARLSWHLN